MVNSGSGTRSILYRGYYGEKPIHSIGKYSSLGMMSAKDAKRYQGYFDDISTGKHSPPGITDVENVKYLQGIERVRDTEALNELVKLCKEYSGEECHRYFREAYDADNVTWDNATPSQLARSWQGIGKRIGIDEYVDITIRKGTVLYRGELNGTEYFTILDAIEKSGRDAASIFGGLQVEKNPIHGYRDKIQGYVFNEEVAGVYGITTANPRFGKGGMPQYFIPNVKEYIQKGILVKVNSIMLRK